MPENREEIDRLGDEFARYIAAFMDGSTLGDPEFDEITTPLGLGLFLARFALAPLGSSRLA